jgi:hypothetical protein
MSKHTKHLRSRRAIIGSALILAGSAGSLMAVAGPASAATPVNCTMSYQYPGSYLACFGSNNTKVSAGQVQHLGGHTEYIYSVTANNIGFYLDFNNTLYDFVTCSIPEWGGECYYATH